MALGRIQTNYGTFTTVTVAGTEKKGEPTASEKTSALVKAGTIAPHKPVFDVAPSLLGRVSHQTDSSFVLKAFSAFGEAVVGAAKDLAEGLKEAQAARQRLHGGF